MSAPRLTRKLVLEAPSQAADGMGGFSTDWTALGTLWAEIQPRTGRDRAGEGGAVSATALRIIVRGAPVGASNRPKPGQRFREGARVFRIEAVTERDANGQYLNCFAEEEVAL